ncbi:family 43 glycosylhydrolase (plasmid) [Pedobacter sp. BS3]|nr:family 43 glycosylhydrolase [Pedobacter sp. BS3]
MFNYFKGSLIVLLAIASSFCSAQQFSDPTAPVGDKRVTMPASVRPVLNQWLRDTYITLGPDGLYYMTGTVSKPPGKKGIYLWSSPDLKTWKELGCIWSMDKDATWQKNWRPVRTKNPETQLEASAYKGIWAPEIHYIKSKEQWLIVACISHGDTFILKSTSGKPEGPYANIEGNEDGPIFDHIDGSLFEDDNGDVYLLGHNHFIGKMKDDLSGLAGPMKRLKETPFNPEPYIEGIYMTKHKGKYLLMQTYWSVKKPDGTYTYIRPDANRNDNIISYDVLVAEADNIYGPYGPRYAAILEGGHNNTFTGKDGGLWSTTFFNPRGQRGKEYPVTCRPAVVALKFDENGKLIPDVERTDKFYNSK